MKNKKVKELKGANMDIDLVSESVDWNQTNCPWNNDDNTKEHKCAVKDTEIRLLLKSALTDKVDDRTVYMKSIDVSYQYEGYNTYSMEELDNK